MKIILVFTLIFILLSLVGCQSVRPYQRVYVNDFEMRPGYPGARSFDETVVAYREGASGGGSTKASGGCGCN